ncbi:MAG: U32 family peptidase [Clostridiales bacterium]|nr:U32 family peptidase [Clostridiales bacterium]
MSTSWKPELLVPAGSYEALQTAVLYGADAVYLGGTSYGLRARAKNFDKEELEKGVAFAHAHGVKVYVTVNIIAHNDQLIGLEDYLRYLQQIQVDALIISDAGILDIARETVPDMELHLSTQASATNYRTMNFWHRQGVKRIVCAREMDLDELKETREKIDPDLDLEAFVHGAMCMSISGRCVLSNYMAGRDANQGACVHPCRWKYVLMEESRPGEYMPVYEDENGSYIFNSKDLCMIEYIPEMVQAGIMSFKIEGRMKTPLYVAMVAKAYREAIDDWYYDPERYQEKLPYYRELLRLVSHRDYSTGFYLGKPDAESQIYDQAQYIQNATFVGKVLETGTPALVEQRNKFSVGDTLFLLMPEGPLKPVKVESITNEQGEAQESAPHARQKVHIALPEAAASGMILLKIKPGQ